MTIFNNINNTTTPIKDRARCWASSATEHGQFCKRYTALIDWGRICDSEGKGDNDI